MKTISAEDLKLALISGTNNIINNKSRIDAMNVFPVPDGDTGTNMSSTVEYAIEEIKSHEYKNVGKISKSFAKGTLFGARGNSGVILSQIFKGLSVGLENKDFANQFDLVAAFELAKEYAYKSVIQPVEGTILTVIRMVSEKLSKTITANNTIQDVFLIAKNEAKKACLRTPDFLSVLKEVGVTDSGGEGLFIILEGISDFFEGNPVKIDSQVKVDVKESFLQHEEEFYGEFGYCTEIIIEIKSLRAFNKDRFKVNLEKLGTSIVIVKDANIVKVHIHAEKPGKILNFCQKFGEFLKIKCENMTIQANESHNAKNKEKNNSSKKINIAIISCNIGSGIIQDMKDLGANFFVRGGQSSNPSARDFIEAIKWLNTDKIIILPNNSNIILTAQQVVQTTDKQVFVIPTKTQMEGLVAMMNFDREGDFNEVRQLMEESLADVKTGQITIASKTTKIEGVSIKKGEFLSIAEHKIIGAYASKLKAAIHVCKKLIDDETEIVTIYYGQDDSEVDALEIASFIETHYDSKVEIKNGGQHTYNFLMAFE